MKDNNPDGGQLLDPDNQQGAIHPKLTDHPYNTLRACALQPFSEPQNICGLFG